MFIVFFIGTAGSGKSLLTASFGEFLKLQKQEVAMVNLDPGAVTLPYTPDVDVRDYVDVVELMEKHGLGPNGALVMAADLMAEDVSSFSKEVESLRPDVALVDTPGQMELFAFRASGPYIAAELTDEPKAVVYLFDAVFSSDPLNYVANLFLSAAVYSRFLLPQVHVLSKCDLLPLEEVERVVDWSTNFKALEIAIEERFEGTKRLLSRDMMKVMYRLGLRPFLIPVSAKTNEGLLNMSAALERALARGERLVP